MYKIIAFFLDWFCDLSICTDLSYPTNDRCLECLRQYAVCEKQSSGCGPVGYWAGQ